MRKSGKRPSKAAKAEKKIISESELLADVNAAGAAAGGQQFKPDGRLPKTSAAIKPRPDKKRG